MTESSTKHMLNNDYPWGLILNVLWGLGMGSLVVVIVWLIEHTC